MGLIPHSIDWLLFLSVSAAYTLLILDNGAAIGWQSANFAPRIRLSAIIYGMLLAFLFKAGLTPFADYLIGFDWVTLVAGGFLFYTIARESHPSRRRESRLSAAVRRIAGTDFWLALDSIITGAHLAHESGYGTFYMWAALVVTLPVTILVTYLVARGISRFAWAIWIASALIGGVAGRLIGSHSGLHEQVTWLKQTLQTQYAVVLVGAGLGLLITAIQQKRTPTTVEA